MFKKKIIFCFITLFFFSTFIVSDEIIIISKVNDEIITNIDLEKQIKYLFLINKKFQNLSKSELLILSKESLIKEIIKKKEIDQFINIKKISDLEDKLIKDNYTNLGFNNKFEYLEFLSKEDMQIDTIKRKLVTEQLWNTLIYEKFKGKVKIDENEIKERIRSLYNNRKIQYELNLSEILFNFDTDNYELIEFIKKYGFDSAAIKYSISNTSSAGGKLGWINLNNLDPTIQNNISTLKAGEFTKTFNTPNGKLILMVNSKREIKNKFNFENETKRLIQFEHNKQLNSYSLNYYKKLKQNAIINDY